MANNFIDAANAIGGNEVGEAGAALSGFCGAYGYVVLVAAVVFLAAGLVFVSIAGRFEAAKAKADAEKAQAEADKARAEATKAQVEAENALSGGAGGGDGDVPQPANFPIGAAGAAAAKGFADALGNAKAWVAMVVIGILLLWMAGNAPQTCLTGSVEEKEEETSNNSTTNSTTTTTNTSTSTTADTSDDAGDNGQAGANRQAASDDDPPPPVPAVQPAGAQ